MNLSATSSRPTRLFDFTPFQFYRVKAIGKGAAGESDWSNIIGDRRSR